MEEKFGVASRVDNLTVEIESIAAKYKRLGYSNYYFAYGLMLATLFSSAAAGVGGLLFSWEPKVVGAVALLPGAFSLAASVLKPQGKSNWHMRKLQKVRALQRQIDYGLPDHPTSDQIASLAAQLTEIDAKMNEEWEAALGMDWSALKKADAR